MDGGKVSLAKGRLADIAPTVLELMGLPKPMEMTGASLLRTRWIRNSWKVVSRTRWVAS